MLLCVRYFAILLGKARYKSCIVAFILLLTDSYRFSTVHRFISEMAKIQTAEATMRTTAQTSPRDTRDASPEERDKPVQERKDKDA